MISNKELMQRRSQAIPRGVGQIHPIFADRAENCRVWDVEGREYLDFAGGIAVLNTGHLHPKVVAAVEAQLKKLSHTCFQVLAYEPYLELCEIMNACGRRCRAILPRKLCWLRPVPKRWKMR
ncbi:hypothetical protein EIMP300_31720 [Escherichia coli]|uniref:4-aminobutyrate--2-oxoglutarate transaminase n=1 Tax=Escherichia coli TaxID=562 RepID=A0A8S0FNM1_ECOLX|nr:hypothetical protein EIMP300_31720 [Escherichia coli]